MFRYLMQYARKWEGCIPQSFFDDVNILRELVDVYEYNFACFTSVDMQYASLSHNWESVKFIYEQLPELDLDPDVLTRAIEGKNIEMVHWLIDHGAKLSYVSIVLAALSVRNFYIFKLLLMHKAKLSNRTMEFIIKRNCDLRFARLAMQAGLRWDNENYVWAAKCRRFDILEWAVRLELRTGGTLPESEHIDFHVIKRRKTRKRKRE